MMIICVVVQELEDVHTFLHCMLLTLFWLCNLPMPGACVVHTVQYFCFFSWVHLWLFSLERVGMLLGPMLISDGKFYG